MTININRTQKLVAALPKGKLLKPTFALLQKAGFFFDEADQKSRKLIIEDKNRMMQALFVKPSDVPIYVEHGIADFGIVGKDSLVESCVDVFTPLELDFGQCNLAIAGYPEDLDRNWRLRSLVRVATKYPNIARVHFDKLGVQAEIISLHGSVELGVLAGLADVIVDIVETGTTLRENGLVVFEEILPVTAMFIVNKASHKLKLRQLDTVISAIAKS
ncbi:MAG: ATP phosphoribosyltransferase [Calditrichaeota bacterium]|nr:MAG: ATP phosphoribosyltransferase [Calditrichota bacterium]